MYLSKYTCIRGETFKSIVLKSSAVSSRNTVVSGWQITFTPPHLLCVYMEVKSEARLGLVSVLSFILPKQHLGLAGMSPPRTRNSRSGWRSNASVDHLSPIQRPTVDMPIQGLVFYCKHSSGSILIARSGNRASLNSPPSIFFFIKESRSFDFSSRLTSCRVSFQWWHFRRSKLDNQSEHLHACLNMN